jgi:hypothetical protein
MWNRAASLSEYITVVVAAGLLLAAVRLKQVGQFAAAQGPARSASSRKNLVTTKFVPEGTCDAKVSDRSGSEANTRRGEHHVR